MNINATRMSLIAVSIALASGCATQSINEADMIADIKPEMSATIQQEVATKPEVVKNTGVIERSTVVDEKTVYFDFDSVDLDEASQQVILENILFLKENPNLVVTIEGHTDSRGSERYNDGLGKSRAEMVKHFMIVSEIDASKIHLVSYGELHPVMTGENDDAWRLNRRATLVYRNVNTQLSSNF